MMLPRLLARSLLLRRRGVLAMAASVAIGTGASTGLLFLFFGVGDRMLEEFRSYGANILVTPAVDRVAGPGTGTLAEADLPKVKFHFWRNAISAAAPLLPLETEVDGIRRTVVGIWGRREIRLGQETFVAGHATLSKGWKLDGEWPSGERVTVGVRTGKRLGEEIVISGRRMRVAGVLSTGGEEDDQVFVDLPVAQSLAGRPGAIRQILVSALTAPETRAVERLGKKYRKDPSSLSPAELESLSCLNTPTAVALAIERNLPGSEARPLRAATSVEGAILSRVRTAFLLLAAIAVAAACLSVLTSMTASVVDRRQEIGLLKALGATDGTVCAYLLLEACLISLLAGAAGYGIGALSSEWIGTQVFGRGMGLRLALLPLALLVAVAISAIGTLLPLRVALRLEPRQVLHEA